MRSHEIVMKLVASSAAPIAMNGTNHHANQPVEKAQQLTARPTTI